MTAAEIRQTIAKHRENRPDMLKATAPEAPKWMYVEWQKWCEELRHLQTKLGMAEAEEAPRWVDAITKQPVKPIFWTYGHSDIHHIKSLSHAEAGKLGGRPRSANPSKDALRLREKRAEALAHNIDRAEKAERRVAELEALLHRARAVIPDKFEDEIQVRADINRYFNAHQG